jgi:hypothetical protein
VKGMLCIILNLNGVQFNYVEKSNICFLVYSVILSDIVSQCLLKLPISKIRRIEACVTY